VLGYGRWALLVRAAYDNVDLPASSPAGLRGRRAPLLPFAIAEAPWYGTVFNRHLRQADA
jgi:hypothetical protein